MVFDCVAVDFGNSKSRNNLAVIKSVFPHAVVIPFVDSYLEMAKRILPETRTGYQWILSSKIDYSDFDFDYIPEQHQATQVHVWANERQQEGDTFLFPKQFADQEIKFLRDYKDVNYHTHNFDYDFDYLEQHYDLSNVMENISTCKMPMARYMKYSDTLDDGLFYPSYWEDLKIYRSGNTFYLPGKALSYIKTQIYDYPFIYDIGTPDKKDSFDICFISNGEPFEQENYDLLQDHVHKNKLKNNLHWIRNVDGRTQAYKQAATTSSTEYFYAVFAKSKVKETFMFDYTVDRALTKRHRIFHAHLQELDVAYGTFNINLYNKTLCLETPDDNILDFTLSQPHEVVPIVSNETVLAPDNYTAWKNAFREVSKLVLWQNKKPTVETQYRLKKWLGTKNEWLAKGAMDGKKFTEESDYNEDIILQTYTWDFCRSKFKSLYPTEIFY